MKNTETEIFIKFNSLLLENRSANILVIPHENPDGDAIGSAIGIAEILSAAGKKVTIVSPNDYPDFLKWFTTDVEIICYSSEKKKAKQRFKNADLLVCVDFNDAKRAGHLEKKIIECKVPKVLIDHHPFPTNFCDLTISEPSYSSTAELIVDVAKNMNLFSLLNKKSAEALYTGILTDTGGFNHNTSNPNTFQVVSELMKFGVNTEKVQAQVYHNFSASRMKLLGYCLHEKMEVFPELRTAVISISKEELERFNFNPGDTEGFVNYPLSIQNIVFSALFIEKENYVKASFRSKGNFPANKFSTENFNGGGHLNAAGGESELSFTDTLAKFKQLLGNYKHQLLETKI